MKTSLLLLLPLLLVAVSAETCIQEENCLRPDCVCATTVSPFSEMPLELTPQFVIVSFNDAITVSNYQFYHDILTNYTNPNGCRMTMTFFLSHLYNDYTLSNELWRLGCEMGVRSVSATPDIQGYWDKANYTVWLSELSDAKKMIDRYGYVDESLITGVRAPFMQIGGDEMFKALNDSNFEYDSSWTALHYTNWYGDPPLGALYPYTLDFTSPQLGKDCPVGKCPKEHYPGLWVTPVLDLNDTRGEPCNMIDACQSNNNETECPEKYCEDNVFEFLKENFDYNYNTNRAPFGLHTNPSWFAIDEISHSHAHTNGYKRFLEYASSLEDVWIVSHNRVLEWMKNPVPAPNVFTLPAFQCPKYDPDSNCPSHLRCEYTEGLPGELERVVMKICRRPCPPNYPWIDNVEGK